MKTISAGAYRCQTSTLTERHKPQLVFNFFEIETQFSVKKKDRVQSYDLGLNRKLRRFVDFDLCIRNLMVKKLQKVLLKTIYLDIQTLISS